jgi:signal transduction histidine kinase
LSNAAKYSPGCPEIDVELVKHDGEIGVVVRDQGMGIASAEQARIFDDFYRAPESRKAGVEGTGLGLALVRRHMKACGGRVDLESAPGEGSVFTLWFIPAAEPPEPDLPTEEPADVSHPDN